MLVNLCKNWGEIMCGLWGLEGFVWDFLSFFETWVDTLIYLTTVELEEEIKHYESPVRCTNCIPFWTKMV